jgi:hypothetical protein
MQPPTQHHEEPKNYINTVFGMQQGNPQLFNDTNEAIVDCLKREKLVPTSYTAQQFKDESGKGRFTFEEASPASRSCQVANGGVSMDSNTQTEQLW